MVDETDILLAGLAAEITGVTNLTGAGSSGGGSSGQDRGVGEAISQIAQQLRQTQQGQSQLQAALRNVRDQAASPGDSGGAGVDVDLSLDGLRSSASDQSSGPDNGPDVRDTVREGLEEGAKNLRDAVDDTVDQARDTVRNDNGTGESRVADGSSSRSKPSDVIRRTQDQIEQVQQQFGETPAEDVGAFGFQTGVDPIDAATGSISKAVGQTGAEFTQTATAGTAELGAEVIEIPGEIAGGLENVKGAVADRIPGGGS